MLRAGQDRFVLKHERNREQQFKPLIQGGFITVPDKPGLGVTLNEELARRYARKGEGFFE